MRLTAFAFEPQFLDHIAPVWKALPRVARGDFLVAPHLVARAEAKGIVAVATDRPKHDPTRASWTGKPGFVASYGDLKEARRLGYGPFVFIEHGAGQSYPQPNGSYAGGPDRADNELILVPSEACATIWRAKYPAARVAVVGCPKVATLPARDGGGLPPVVAISFHWPAPQYGTAWADFGPRLEELSKAFTVIGHCHPKADWPDRMRHRYERWGIPFVRDFEDVCRQADVYVCDNSSTIFEFAATGRPVVLMNSHQWTKKRNIGLRFWDAAHVGLNVDDPKRLVETVRLALQDPPEVAAQRADALRLVYGITEDTAGVAARAIMDWLSCMTPSTVGSATVSASVASLV